MKYLIIGVNNKEHMCNNLLELKNELQKIMEEIPDDELYTNQYRVFAIKDLDSSEDIEETKESILADTLMTMESAGCYPREINGQKISTDHFADYIMKNYKKSNLKERLWKWLDGGDD